MPAEFHSVGFTLYVAKLIKVCDAVALWRIEIRLAQKLLGLADADAHFAMTHPRLASELGTAGEVISSHMHDFQRRNWIYATPGENRRFCSYKLKTLVGAL